MRHLVPTIGTNNILHMENYKNLIGIFNVMNSRYAVIRSLIAIS